MKQISLPVAKVCEASQTLTEHRLKSFAGFIGQTEIKLQIVLDLLYVHTMNKA